MILSLPGESGGDRIYEGFLNRDIFLSELACLDITVLIM